MEEFSDFDFLSYGEGEVTLHELCMHVDKGLLLSCIDGLVYRANGKIIKNKPRALIKDIDTLPMPARDLISQGDRAGHVSRGFSSKLKSAEVFTSRGCPIGCYFCAIQTVFGKTIRFRSVQSIDDEIKHVQSQYGADHIIISDDAFTLKHSRAMELCEIFSRYKLKSWNCNTRVNAVNKELLIAMKRSGCEKISYGVESGSQRIMDKIGKKITVEQVEKAVKLAYEAGFRHVEGNFIIGAHPSETAEDLDKTLQLIQRLPFSMISVTVIVPFPGTPVYKWMKENNAFSDDIDWEDFVMFGKAPKWRTEHFSPEMLLEHQRRITRKFFLNPRYISSQLVKIRSTEELNYWVSSGFSYIKWYIKKRI